MIRLPVKTNIAVAVIAIFCVFATPSVHASVLGEIQNNFTQAFNKILQMAGFVASEENKAEISTSEKKDDLVIQQKETAVGPGGAIYTISGGEGFPVFERDLIVDPAHSETGKPQTFSIWARDPSGVAIVKAIINTDKGKKEITLSVNEGNDKEGKWSGSWSANDVQEGQYYKIIFQAVGKSGGKAEMPFLSKAKSK